MKNAKATIPAAGLGTRLIITKALAKEMLLIVDKPTIQFIVEEAPTSIEDILVVTVSQNVLSKTTFDSNSIVIHLNKR